MWNCVPRIFQTWNTAAIFPRCRAEEKRSNSSNTCKRLFLFSFETFSPYVVGRLTFPKIRATACILYLLFTDRYATNSFFYAFPTKLFIIQTTLLGNNGIENNMCKIWGGGRYPDIVVENKLSFLLCQTYFVVPPSWRRRRWGGWAGGQGAPGSSRS